MFVLQLNLANQDMCKKDIWVNWEKTHFPEKFHALKKLFKVGDKQGNIAGPLNSCLFSRSSELLKKFCEHTCSLFSVTYAENQ